MNENNAANKACITMEFAWDTDKSDRCLRDRGFDFEFAAHLFDGPTLQFVDERKDYGELRVIAIGEIEGKTYKIAFVDRGGVRRIISAHRASRQENRKWQSYINP
jgi:uncharacterized DUF497 family protein